MTLFALGGMFAGALAAPAANVESSLVQKRDNNTQAADVLVDLYANVQVYTGTINSTTAALNADSTAADNATASAIVNDAVANITAAVNVAIPNINALAKRALIERQSVDPTAIGALLSNILLDISGALNNVIATLGLSMFPLPSHTCLQPLT